MLAERIVSRIANVGLYEKEALRRQVLSVGATLDDVRPYLKDPESKPYGRCLVFADRNLEVIAMNWTPGVPCLPHDHGKSVGWVQVICGAVEHTICADGTSATCALPRPVHTTVEKAGSLIFATTGLVHSMRAIEGERTVTLHFYAPPISGMRVFDLGRGTACVVTDDCGAWWPAPHQLLRLLTPEPAPT